MASQSSEDKPENPGAFFCQILFWFLIALFSSSIHIVAQKVQVLIKKM